MKLLILSMLIISVLVISGCTEKTDRRMSVSPIRSANVEIMSEKQGLSVVKSQHRAYSFFQRT